MSLLFQAAKWSMRAASRSRYNRFLESLNEPKQAQQETLKSILALTKQQKLPSSLTVYSDYPSGTSWNLETVQHFEPTSGSSGKGKKWIPYTQSLLNSFQSMFKIWSYDVLSSGIELKSGKTFISISPPQKNQSNDDTEYLGSTLRYITGRFLVAQDLVGTDSHDFFNQVARQLAQAEDLEIISVWSPSYLSSLMKTIASECDAYSMTRVRRQLARSRNWSALWPSLKFVSAWGSANSKTPFEQIAALFPQVHFQKKGLLSTEAPVTVPLFQSDTGALPLWLDVYLEVLDQHGDIRPLYSIKEGEKAEVLITSFGGLKRYQLGDQVVCTTRLGNSPVVEFIGRKAEISDLVGEKIESTWLTEELSHLHGDWLVLPIQSRNQNPSYYQLLHSEKSGTDFESALKGSYHYQLARDQNQLSSAKQLRVPNLIELKQSFFERHGISRGDIKDSRLLTDPVLANEFVQYLDLPNLPFQTQLKP